MNNDYELRAAFGLSLDEGGKKIIGTAIKYNSLSRDLGGFVEEIMPGAVRHLLTGGTNIKALLEHDASKLLGNLADGTLRIADTSDGLTYELDLPETSYANDLRAAMKANPTAYGGSFKMRLNPGSFRWDRRSGPTPKRIIHKIDDMPEITVTAFPAYPETTAALRSLREEIEHEVESVDLAYAAAMRELLTRQEK